MDRPVVHASKKSFAADGRLIHLVSSENKKNVFIITAPPS
jgi:hypothetical protein